MNSNLLTDLLHAILAAIEQGYTADFIAHPNGYYYCHNNPKEQYAPKDFILKEAIDCPTSRVTLYVLATKSGVCGTLVHAWE
jgi:hypothetical protein